MDDKDEGIVVSVVDDIVRSSLVGSRGYIVVVVVVLIVVGSKLLSSSV